MPRCVHVGDKRWVRMGRMTGVPEDALDYEAIVAAVMETPRGRWFLREHERHIRASETDTLLAETDAVMLIGDGGRSRLV